MISAKEAVKLTKAARKKVEDVKKEELQTIRDYVDAQITAAAEAGDESVKIYFENVENGLDRTYQKIIHDELTDACYMVYRIFNNVIEIEWLPEFVQSAAERRLNEAKKKK